MSKTNAGRVAICLILALCTGPYTARSQDKDSGKPPKPGDAAKTKRIA